MFSEQARYVLNPGLGAFGDSVFSAELQKVHTLALCVPGLQCFQLLSILEWLAVHPDLVIDTCIDFERKFIVSYTARNIELALRQLYRAALAEFPDASAYLPANIFWNDEDMARVIELAACLQWLHDVAPDLLCVEANIFPVLLNKKIQIGFGIIDMV